MGHDGDAMNPPVNPTSHAASDPGSRRRSGGSTPRAKYLAFAVTAPGIEEITLAELLALGIKGPRLAKGGVSFMATTRQLYLANLWLRSATRVVVRATRFRATTFAELEAELLEVPWAQWLDPAVRVRFRVASHGSQLYHTGAIEERLLRVVGQPAPRAPHRDPAGDADGGSDDLEDGEDRENDDGAQLIIVRVNHNEVTISIDSSGAALSQRGYRRQVAKAPLRENLAAALLLAAGWDGSSPLIDPMCGSGTIPIEAALIARRIPPGHRRGFAFADWPGFEPGTWSSVVGAARQSMLDASPVPIVAADRDAGAVGAVEANAERAGVLDDLEIRRAPISELGSPANPESPMTPVAPGWLITNPPYGSRIASDDLRDLYARLGQAARAALPGWQCGLLVADTRLAGHTRLGLTERLRFSTGGLGVRYLTGQI